MSNSNKHKICVYLQDKTNTLIDANMHQSGAVNRSEFINKAVECYCAVLNKENTARVLTPALESVIQASIKETENHLSKIIYKDAVATAMMMHVMAICYDIDATQLDDVRAVCVKEVNHLNGRFKFEDAVNYEG